MTRSTRKMGLGVMGFADMLLYLGIPYNSEEGVAMAKRVMKLVNTVGHEDSESWPDPGSVPAVQRKHLPAAAAPIRNGTVTTIAPTGTCPSSPAFPPAWSPSLPTPTSATSWTAPTWWRPTTF